MVKADAVHRCIVDEFSYLACHPNVDVEIINLPKVFYSIPLSFTT